MIKVAIILINWKGAKDTNDCLASIAAQERVQAFQTVVVDNASGDGSPDQIVEFCERAGIGVARVAYDRERADTEPSPLPGGPAPVTLIEADDNLGFCVGNNVGAAYAFACGADAALILNNDTIIAPDMLERLSVAAETLGPRVLISPQILYADRPDIIWWFGGGFSPFLSPSYRHQGDKKQLGFDGYPETDWVSGCATLISRDLFKEIGLYDPLFFIWCEEWDLSLRARARGVSLRVAPDAFAYHKVGKSLGLVSPLTFFYAMRNMIFLRQRYLRQPLLAALWLVYLPRKLTQAIGLAWKKRDPIYLWAFLDGLIDREGGIWKRQ